MRKNSFIRTSAVALDGKPLPFGTVTFEAKGLRSATGKVVNGEITEVTTYDPGDGAPVGNHRVVVTANAEPGAAIAPNPGGAPQAPKGEYMSGKSLIPSAYNNPDTSGLTAEIKSGGKHRRIQAVLVRSAEVVDFAKVL